MHQPEVGEQEPQYKGAYPVGRVGAEASSLGGFPPSGRLDEPGGALLDEVERVGPLPTKLEGDVHHQAEVVHHQAAHRVGVALVAGAPSEGPLVLLAEQGVATNLLQEAPQRVARTSRDEGPLGLRGRADDLVADQLGVEHLADQGVVVAVVGRVVLIVVRRVHCARWISTTSEGGKIPAPGR